MSTIKSSAENLTLNADGANNDIKFQSNGSEVASIDQAGLLTASGVTVTGVVKVGTGDISSVDSNSIVVGSGATNLRMIGVTNDIRPANADGTNSDNDIDLGDASARFKDLYLSGGLLVGGTGAANTLDDYEEGTWTPVVKVGTTVNSGSNGTSVYTKIGRQVTAYTSISSIALSGTGDLTVSGLPFANANAYGAPAACRFAGINSGGRIVALINPNVSSILFQNYSTTSGYTGETNNSHLSSTYNLYNVGITYFI